MNRTTLLLLCLGFIFSSQAQKNPKVEILNTGTNTSLRGLSVVNDNIVWVSGSNGMVGKSTNGGKNFKWYVVSGFAKSDFRDIEAFDANTAIIMAIAEPAYILKTIDGGESWKVVYENKTKGMFLDAMDFASAQQGIVVGDPINGKPFLAKTNDSGNTWQEVDANYGKLAVDSGEAFFASSGTNIKYFNDESFRLVSGGQRARLLDGASAIDLELPFKTESTGANSIDIFDNGIADHPGSRIAIVGGDFMHPEVTDKNATISLNGGKTWFYPSTPPHGYRSCVEFLSKKDLLACGLNGVDYSHDSGKTWKWISKEGFHACRIAKLGTTVYLAGGKGKIGKIVWADER